MRTLIELYRILWDKMKTDAIKVEPQQYLVWLVSNNKITSEEFQAIMVHYKKNKPTKRLHSKFYNHPTFSKNERKQDWWNQPYTKEVRRQMRLFVRKMIRINRNEKA